MTGSLKTLVGIRHITEGLTLPEDFPNIAYESIRNRVAPKIANPSDQLDQFLGAWNAVLYRFMSCAEHDVSFSECIKKVGNAPPRIERYIQERELFNFFMNGLATIESLYYALCVLGSLLNAKNFPLDVARNINPKKTASQFQMAFPSENLTAILNRTAASSDLQEWKNIRNTLAHRTAPGRLVDIGPRGEALWKLNGMPVNGDATSLRRKWLANAVSEIMCEAETFSRNRF